MDVTALSNLSSCSISFHVTFWRLAKVAIFTIPIAIGMINHKCVCGALNSHFCQTPVPVAQLFKTNEKF